MKKQTYFISIIAVLAILFGACSGDSYQKRLDKEKEAIERFLSDNGIDVLKTYPKNHKFEDNQYYLEGTTGVYLQVVDPGDTSDTLSIADKDVVYMRFDSVRYMVSDYWELGNRNNYGTPVVFEYGNTKTYSGGLRGTDVDLYYMSPACVLPLQKGVGKGAEINLIVPFINGSSYQSSKYEPFFFTGLTYDYNKALKEPEDSENTEE